MTSASATLPPARIHFNHAGASLPSAATLAAVQSHLALEARVGPMEAAALVAPALEKLRVDTAHLLNAEPAEVAFTSSGSAAFGLAFSSLKPLRAGDRILVGRHEWGGNVASYQRAAARSGAKLEVIPCRADGSVDPDALAARIDARVRLISLTWLPANGGLINDAAAIGRVANAAGVPYLIDAGQALGQVPVDVRALGCDILKSAGRKHLRGPRGTAVLYVRRGFLETLEPPWVDVSSAPWQNDVGELRADARRFESGEVAVALHCGLAQAAAEALAEGIAVRFARVQTLAMQLRDALDRLPSVTRHDLGDGPQSGLVAFNVRGMDAEQVKLTLAQADINVGANAVPYTPFDMQARGLHSVVRASVSATNTEAEIDALMRALDRIIRDTVP